MKAVCQVDFPNIFNGDLGAGDRSLNLHPAFGGLVKLLSAPVGRYRYKIFSLSCNLKQFLLSIVSSIAKDRP